MPAQRSYSVSKILLNRQAFELVCRSNYLLSVKEQKQRQLQQVIGHMLQSIDAIPQSCLAQLGAIAPLEGETSIFIRLTDEEATKMNALQADALSSHNMQLSRRDTVIALCIGIVEKYDLKLAAPIR